MNGLSDAVVIVTGSIASSIISTAPWLVPSGSIMRALSKSPTAIDLSVWHLASHGVTRWEDTPVGDEIRYQVEGCLLETWNWGSKEEHARTVLFHHNT